MRFLGGIAWRCRCTSQLGDLARCLDALCAIDPKGRQLRQDAGRRVRGAGLLRCPTTSGMDLLESQQGMHFLRVTRKTRDAYAPALTRWKNICGKTGSFRKAAGEFKPRRSLRCESDTALSIREGAVNCGHERQSASAWQQLLLAFAPLGSARCAPAPTRSESTRYVSSKKPSGQYVLEVDTTPRFCRRLSYEPVYCRHGIEMTDFRRGSVSRDTLVLRYRFRSQRGRHLDGDDETTSALGSGWGIDYGRNGVMVRYIRTFS